MFPDIRLEPFTYVSKHKMSGHECFSNVYILLNSTAYTPIVESMSLYGKCSFIHNSFTWFSKTNYVHVHIHGPKATCIALFARRSARTWVLLILSLTYLLFLVVVDFQKPHKTILCACCHGVVIVRSSTLSVLSTSDIPYADHTR